MDNNSQERIKDVWLSYDVSRGHGLNETVYAVTAYLHSSLGFNTSLKRLSWIVAALYQRYNCESPSSPVEAHLVISLNKNHYFIKKGCNPVKELRANNKELRSHWYRFEDMKEVLNLLSCNGFITIHPGSYKDNQTTTLTNTDKLRSLFLNPPQHNKNEAEQFQEEITRQVSEKTTFIKVRDADKNLTDTVTGTKATRTRDMISVNNTLKAIHDLTWTTDQQVLLTLTEETLQEATADQKATLFNILSSYLVEYHFPQDTYQKLIQEQDINKGIREEPSNTYQTQVIQEDTGYTISNTMEGISEGRDLLSPVPMHLLAAGSDYPRYPQGQVMAGQYLITRLLSFDRVHNNSRWDNGGRLYGLIQNIPSVFRKHITINGKPIIGLDFSCFHVLMIAHMKGIEVPASHDAYTSEALQAIHPDRSFHKAAVNALINAPKEKRDKYLWAVLGSCEAQAGASDRKVTPKEYIDAVIEHNPWLEGELGIGKGLFLQFMDSRIALKLVNKWMVKKGKMIIPLHDGFYLEPEYAEEFKQDMVKAYASMKEFNGFEPRIKKEVL